MLLSICGIICASTVYTLYNFVMLSVWQRVTARCVSVAAGGGRCSKTLVESGALAIASAYSL